MNFQPMDYLNDLNLDFDSQFSPKTEQGTNDLDLFSKSDFFDLDEFSNYSKPVIKQNEEEEVISPASSGSPSATSISAYEDKRKRNTAASARFRIKKKLKQQEMETKCKNLQDKVGGLEKKLLTLEMENKCLKNLILQKNEEKNDDLLQSIKKRSADQPFFQHTK